MKILLLSAYDAESHRRWHQTLVAAFDEYEWTVLTLPPRYFSWRLRGNSLSWAFGERETLERDYDLLVATSMVDLSALRGFVPHLAAIPTLVYFHENQFAYPDSGQQRPSVEPKMLNIYTALAADSIAFNSAYNRDSLLEGAAELLAKMPDQVPSGLVGLLENRSQVLPVPVKPVASNIVSKPDQRLQLLWNHRWEYDKGPDRLLAAMRLLVEAGVGFDVHIVGQQFRQQPAAMTALKDLLDNQSAITVKQWGYLESAQQYQQCLSSADVVLSTALHDFQGLSVLEAVASGCIPLVPDRLCYPEWFGEEFRYHSMEAEPMIEALALADRIGELIELKKQAALPAVPAIEPLLLTILKPEYAKVFQATIDIFHSR